MFCAWAAYGLVDESLLFDAHDNSALRVPLVIPQGIWTFGILAFCVMILVLAVESVLSLLLGRGEELDRLLSSRTHGGRDGGSAGSGRDGAGGRAMIAVVFLLVLLAAPSSPRPPAARRCRWWRSWR